MNTSSRLAGAVITTACIAAFALIPSKRGLASNGTDAIVITSGTAAFNLPATTAAVVQDKKKPRRIERKPAPTIRPQGAIRPQRFFDTTLKIVEGGGEFEFLKDEIVVLEPVAVTLQWTTTKASATTGRWEVRLAEGGVVANGVASSAPAPGHIHRVRIPAGAFLYGSPPSSDTRFSISIRPYGSGNTPVGGWSNKVYVKQLAEESYPEPTDFGDGATFPSVRLLGMDESIGQIRLTQLYATHADVQVQVSNGSNRETDPMWLKLKDHVLLYRQDSAPVSVPALKPGEAVTYDVRLNAILPPPRSQTPQARQVREWRRTYADRCGPELRSVLDWRGPQSQTPMDAHRESLLAMPGWEDYTGSPPSARICGPTQCVKLCEMEKQIRSQLDGNVVGYAYVVGGTSPKFGAGGKARTAANEPAIDFTTETPITVASVSKLISALATIRVLTQNGLALNTAIGPFFPTDWNVGQYFQNVTFTQLLGQQSGIKDYGNVDLTYAKLQTFFQQPVANSWTPACTGSGTIDPPNAVNPTAAMQRCYSNYNFAILRILLPAVAGLPVDNNLTTRPMTLANQYEQLVQDNVFERVNQFGTGCRPLGSVPHAFAYKFPGDEPGFDWGDVRLSCGGAGWYVSAEDMAKVLFSINSRDGRILTESSTQSQLDQMRTGYLGLDNWNNANFMEKNGGWSAAGTNISTTAAIFGPVTGPNVVGVLFVNSDISGGSSSGSSAKQVLINAYNNALQPK